MHVTEIKLFNTKLAHPKLEGYTITDPNLTIIISFILPYLNLHSNNIFLFFVAHLRLSFSLPKFILFRVPPPHTSPDTAAIIWIQYRKQLMGRNYAID